MRKLKSLAPGLLLCLGIAIPAWFLGKAVPIIGSPVFGILLGMAIASVFSSAFSKIRPWLDDGIKYTSKKILQYSIILLGFDMNLFNVLNVGGQSLAVMLFTISSSFIVAYGVGKALKLDGKTTTLIGVGTSICGGSAIAATAPVIQAEDAEVAHAISTIFLFNIVAVFLFPPLGRLLGMSDEGFGMWAGTAINDTSSVVAASSAWSSAAGNDAALKFATIVKLTRTLMIVPIVLALAIYRTRKSAREEGGAGFPFAKVFPWFVLGFAAAALLNTFAGIPASVARALFTLGKFMIVMAMTAIGLNTNIKKLLANGFGPIFLGLCCWLAVASTSLLVQMLTKMW
ncbi:MAG: YeiH family protein [Spirochaetota bacterium]